MSELTSSGAEWLDVPVRVTPQGEVFFGDQKLPGVIAENGVTVYPAAASVGGINRLVIEFFVGEVIVDDATGEKS